MAQPKPPCPRCKSANQVVRQGEFFYCERCRGFFDDDTRPGADGGDYYNDPTKRIEKQETRRR